VYYLFKELNRHRWRTIAGISGYLLAILFIMLVLSVTETNEDDSVRILKGTGTHFIVYIPTDNSCCSPGNSDSTDGSLIAEGGYTMMLNSDLIYSIREIPGIKDASPYLLYRIFYAVTDINLSISYKETLLIKGRSGAGKLTLLNLMAGLIRPTTGKVIIGGNNISDMSNESLSRFLMNDIGIIFQSFNLLPTYNIIENIEIGLVPGHKDKKGISKKIMSYLEKFELTDKIYQLPAELSIGQQQKVAIIRTLVKEPSVIFADEPTGSVDDITAKEILAHLVDLRKERDVTLILASHGNIPDEYANRVIVMGNGQFKL